eukprot:jgi/Astpho2/7096/Aster-01925
MPSDNLHPRSKAKYNKQIEPAGSLDGQLALSEEGAGSNRDVEDDHTAQHLLRHADSDVEANEEGGRSSKLRVAGNLFISFVGAGVLGLPHAFQRTGLLQGGIFMLLVAGLNLHCMMLLVKCKRRLQAAAVVSYSEVVRHTLGRPGQLLVELLLIMSQMGFCVAYLIFIGQNLTTLTNKDPAFFILAAGPILVALAMLRGVHALAPFSLIADAANICGILVVVWDEFGRLEKGTHIRLFSSLGSLPFLFGVVIYCYEGVGMILPIESSMKEREHFGPVLSGTIALITAIFLGFGAIGYAAFGDDTKDIITLNLPADWSTTLVKILLCLGLFLTFPIMMVPVYELIERGLLAQEWFSKKYGSFSKHVTFCVIRTALVLTATVVAVAVPGFGSFISLIGSGACATLSFTVPALCHMLIFRSEGGWATLAMDALLVAFGIIGAVLGTCDSVAELIRPGV